MRLTARKADSLLRVITIYAMRSPIYPERSSQPCMCTTVLSFKQVMPCIVLRPIHPVSWEVFSPHSKTHLWSMRIILKRLASYLGTSGRRLRTSFTTCRFWIMTRTLTSRNLCRGDYMCKKSRRKVIIWRCASSNTETYFLFYNIFMASWGRMPMEC